MGRTLRFVLTFLVISLVCCVACAAPACADEANDSVVKVGVYGNSVYSYQDENGMWRGIDIECLTDVAQREGLKLEFIDSVNDPDFLGSLNNGTYDIVTDVVATPQRQSAYLFADLPLGSASSANVAARADDGRWTYGNVEQLSQMKIGVVSSFSNNAAFRAWCAERGVTPQLVEFASIGEMSDALAAGEIDGEVYGAIYGDSTKIRTLLQLDPSNLYYVFRQDDKALKNKIDEAMAQIMLEDPYYFSNLNSKYAAQRNTASNPLSSAEQSYIDEHRTATVAVVKDDEPYYWKTSDGSDAGILPDYFALISEQTGLDFRFVVYDTPDAEIAAVKNGEVDAIGMYANGIIFADQDGLLLTQGYASTNNVLLARSGTGKQDIKSIAINQRSSDVVGTALLADFKSADLKTYGNASECFQALQSGQADAIVCGLPSATWLMNQTNAINYSTTPLAGASSEFCMAVSSDNRTLCTLLGKGISATKTSYDGIVTNDTLPGTDLRSLVERIPALWLAAAAVILLALAIALAVVLFKLRRRQNERAAVEAAKAENERRETEIAALEKSAREKNQFFSNISHDMRTPLNAVIGFSELAKGPGVSADEKDAYFSKIQTSGNLLLALINDTLTLSKINSNKLELHPTAVFTEDIGDDVTTPIREAAARKHIEFSLDKSGYRPRTVMADALNVEKIFLNLLSNAIKYTPSGGRVQVRVADDLPGAPDPDIVFTICDNGIGISDEFMPHLFEPFATEGRADAESTGTGLGLSIVKNLVDLMGGTIDVESAVGNGTTFTVRLHLPVVEDVSSVRALQVPQSEDASYLMGKRVLLCEDNAINAEVAGLMLQKLGIDFEVATNGKKGLDSFAQSQLGYFDAILMDVRMPVMDGMEATRAIRALERDDAGAIPIIALTADAFDDDIRRDREAGMDAHVSKPIDPEVLAAVLVEQLRKCS